MFVVRPWLVRDIRDGYRRISDGVVLPGTSGGRRARLPIIVLPISRACGERPKKPGTSVINEFPTGASKVARAERHEPVTDRVEYGARVYTTDPILGTPRTVGRTMRQYVRRKSRECLAPSVADFVARGAERACDRSRATAQRSDPSLVRSARSHLFNGPWTNRHRLRTGGSHTEIRQSRSVGNFSAAQSPATKPASVAGAARSRKRTGNSGATTGKHRGHGHRCAQRPGRWRHRCSPRSCR